MKYLGGLDREGLTNDLNATTISWRHGYHAPNVAVVGYCMAVRVVLRRNPGTVGAAVSFYGGGVETGASACRRCSNWRPR